jgi:hypothetical protein
MTAALNHSALERWKLIEERDDWGEGRRRGSIALANCMRSI